MATPTSFQTPFGAGKEISGYIKGTEQKRPLLFKNSFGDVDTTWHDTVNYDIQGNQRNLMGQFVDPDVDTYRIQLPNFGTKELSFAYTKEKVGSPAYSEIYQRVLGQQPNSVSLDKTTLARAVAQNMQTQFQKAYERIENLHELIRTNLLVYGTFNTTLATPTGQHKEVKWDMGRTTYAWGTGSTQGVRDANKDAFLNEIIPEGNLTTIKANTSTDVAGGLSWDSKDGANSNAAVTQVVAVDPIKHVNRWMDVAANRAGTDYIVMGDDAWSWYLKALNTTYKDMMDTQFSRKAPLLSLDLYPHPQEIEGLTLQGFHMYGATPVPVYTYNGRYTDRDTGVKTRFMPQGYVLLVPPKAYGAVRYGKIQHIKAYWAAQQIWINSWKGEKNGIEEFEMHSNFVIYHTDIDSVVCYKVCGTSVAV